MASIFPTPDSANTAKTIAFIRARAEEGSRKYGVTMDRADLTPMQWLQHHREELADALEYSSKLEAVMKLCYEQHVFISSQVGEEAEALTDLYIKHFLA